MAALKSAQRRWPRRLQLGVALLALLTLVASLWTVSHLEVGFVRERVRAVAAQQLHLSIQYDKAGLGMHGFVLEGFTVASMPVDRDLAPNLLAIDRIALTWHPGDLLRRRWNLTELAISGVALDVVVDTAGKTSLERVLEALPKQPEEPKTPLSQLFAKLREQPAVGIERFALTGLRVDVATRLAQGGVDKLRIGDLALQGRVQTGISQPVLELDLAGPHLQVADALRKRVPELLEASVQDLDLTGHVSLTAPNRLSVRLGLGAALRAELALEGRPQLHAVQIDVKQLQVGTLLSLATSALLFDEGERELAHVLRATLTAELPELRQPGLLLRAPRLQAGLEEAHVARDPKASTVQAWRADVRLAGASVQQPEMTAQIGALHVALSGGVAQPGAMTVHAAGELAQVDAVQLENAATLTDAQFAADLAVLPEGATLTCAFPVAALAVRAGGDSANVTRLKATLRAETGGLAALLAQGVGALRAFELSLDAEQVDALAAGQAVAVEAAHARLLLPPLQLAPGPEVTAQGTLQAEVGAAVVRAPGGVVVRDAAAQASVTDLHWRADEPQQATAKVAARLHVGPLTARAEVDKQPETLAWHLDWNIPNFMPLLAMAPLPESVRKAIAWPKLSLSGRSDGHAEGLRVTQRTVLDVRGLEARRIQIPKVHAELASRGQGPQQDLDLTLEADLARVGTLRPGRVSVAGHGSWDPAARSMKLDVRGQGAQGLDAGLQLQARPHGADLGYTAAAHVAGLGALVRGLPLAQREGFCLGDLGLRAEIEASGTVLGGARLLAGQGGAGTDGQHHVTGDLRRVACRKDGASAEVSRARWSVDAHLRGAALEAKGQANIEEVDVASAGRNAHLEGWRQNFSIRRATDGTAHVATDGVIGRIVQDALPDFPARDVAFQVSGWSGAEQARIESFELDDPASGTHVTLNGGLDRTALHPPRVDDADVAGQTPRSPEPEPMGPVPGRLGLSITGEVRQDLARLWHDDKIAGKGRVVVPFRLESGDLVVFRADARMRFEDVDLDLDKRDLHVHGVRGELPVLEVFALKPTFALIGGGEDNAYARWRFADHQPFLRRDDFLSIGKISHRGLVIGPLAGNASLDRDVFRLDQIEATLLQGKVTGQCIVQALGAADPRVLLRGNATGLRVAGSDERFDANAALDFLPLRRSLDGRMEILHVGRKHLEALLDFIDPYAEDASMNRVRKLLVLGHPEHVRMRFQHGFADFAVELGGLGSVVKIEEVRGIALGPVFQRWLDPLLSDTEARP